MNRVNHSSKTTATAKPILRIMLILGILVQTIAFTACSGDDGKDDGGNPGGKSNYKTAEIGTQVWMAENLNIPAEGSKCYEGDPANCEKCGRLYDWETARKVCPSGWRLPTKGEWTTLVEEAGGYTEAGKKLKTTSGWMVNGTDDYEFSALPCGMGMSGDLYAQESIAGFWWTDTADEENDASAHHCEILYFSSIASCLKSSGKNALLSVRCIKD